MPPKGAVLDQIAAFFFGLANIPRHGAADVDEYAEREGGPHQDVAGIEDGFDIHGCAVC